MDAKHSRKFTFEDVAKSLRSQLRRMARNNHHLEKREVCSPKRALLQVARLRIVLENTIYHLLELRPYRTGGTI